MDRASVRDGADVLARHADRQIAASQTKRREGRSKLIVAFRRAIEPVPSICRPWPLVPELGGVAVRPRTPMCPARRGP